MTMRRIVSLVLAVTMVLCMLPVSVLAAATYMLDVQYYGESDGGSPVQNTGGTVTGEGNYEAGASVTVTATPDADNGYCTTLWSDASDNPEEPAIMNGYGLFDRKTEYTFTMPEKTQVLTITFAKHSYTGYTPSEDGQTHDVHCIYCGVVQTTGEAHVDETGAGDDPSNGYCDKCDVKIPGKYIVNFDGNHQDATGKVYDQIVDVDTTTTLPANGFTLDGHTFQGWAVYADGSGTWFQPGDTYTVNADTTFYAIWNDNAHVHSHPTTWTSDKDNHWHECECGDMKDRAAHTPGPAATATTPQTCTVCGYVIASATGYTLTINYAVTSSGVTVGSGSKTVTGITPGTVVDLSKYWPGSEATGSDGKTYYFVGFTKKGEIAVINSVTVTGDVELEAAWTTEKQITVDLNPNGGTLPYARTRENYDESIYWMNREHIPVRAAYEFVGWSLADDGTADSGDTQITADCTLYAVWQQYLPSYDDDYYDPPPASIPVDVGGDYDAILRDGEPVKIGGYKATLRDDVVIVRGNDPISGTLDLGKTNAEAIRFTDDAVRESIAKGDISTIVFSDGTAATMTGSAWAAAYDALRSGESLQIAVTQVDAGALPEELTTPTEEGPYGGNEFTIDTSIFSAAGIENIEDRLKTLGLINGGTDTSITEEEFEYLYHYLTTSELLALKTELNEMIESGNGHDGYLQKVVAWLDKMIERDATSTAMTLYGLKEYADLTDQQMQILSDMGLQNVDNPTIGQIRQLGLTLEQMELLYAEIDSARAEENEPANQYDVLLSWLADAIAQKELEASYAQMDSLIEEARSTNGSYTGLNDVKDAAKDMTTDELERFLAKASAAKNSDSGPLPVLALGALDDVIDFLTEELEARQAQEDAQDAPTYINIGGERFAFVSAVEVDVKAVKVSGRTRNIQLKADQSDAFMWSTHVPKLLLDAPGWGVNNLRAYKVLDNGGLEAKAAKVTVNADGTLTLSAMSNGNSTYIFVLEPGNSDVKGNPYTGA